MSGKELKSHVTEEQFEDEKDRKIGNELREEADKIEVPDKLKPERIELMLREHTEQKVKRWKPIYTAIAAACCAVIVGGTAIGVELDKKSDSNYTASSKEKTKSKNTEKAAAGPRLHRLKIMMKFMIMLKRRKRASQCKQEVVLQHIVLKVHPWTVHRKKQWHPQTHL